jgi:O-methyltransferase
MLVLNVAKRLTHSAFGAVGLQVRRKPKTVTDITMRLPFPEATCDEQRIVDACAPYTMTSLERQWALLKAVQYIDRHAIPGDIVECGVWRGGSIMLAKMARADHGLARRYVLFDTFKGMTPPTNHDVSYKGERAAVPFAADEREDHNTWCYASLQEVERNLSSVGFAPGEVVLRQGPVEETLRDRGMLPDRIALLRLDTDWYESTRIELEVLYPRLVSGGVLIVDDYGHWEGSRRAVDEYFRSKVPLLVAVDYAGRVAIKPPTQAG